MMRLLFLLTISLFLLKNQAAMATIPCAAQVDTALAAISATPLSSDTWQCKSGNEVLKLSKAPPSFFNIANPTQKILCFFDNRILNFLTAIEKARQSKATTTAALADLDEEIRRIKKEKRPPTEVDAKEGVERTRRKDRLELALSGALKEIATKQYNFEQWSLIEHTGDQLRISKGGANMFVNIKDCKFAFEKKPDEKKPLEYETLAQICAVFKKNNSASPFCETSPSGSGGASSTAPPRQ